MAVDVNVMVGGEAGQGVQSVGHMLAKTAARAGFHVFADQDYESRVRGGHNFFRVRLADRGVGAVSEPVDALVALNEESIALHRQELSDSGRIILDSGSVKDSGDTGSLLGVPLQRLAKESAGNEIMANTVALGVVIELLDLDPRILGDVVRDQFGVGDVGDANVAAAEAGYGFARANFEGAFSRPLGRAGDGRRMLLTGNEAIALGALAAGCKFVAAYPMTPATSIMEYIASKADDLGVVVVQPEDEISAINMIIGAGFAGVRAMTATSGGGFCLMVEGLGLAGMTETPVVIVEGQRAGPAIGLPTRTEQSDLEFMIYAAHGEFPRAVLAPASVEDAFWLTVRAFNLADKYQIPVILLTDQHLASSYATAEVFDLSKVTVDRGLLLSASDLERPDEYRRHRITESGLSPRAVPLDGTALVATDSDEHDEQGHMIEDAETRTAMMQKRLRKLRWLVKEVTGPTAYGPSEAEVTLVGWGSTHGAIKEAVDIAARNGRSVNMLHFNELWPFPAEATALALQRVSKSFVVENNATAQLAHLLRAETGHRVTGRVLKFDGRPFSPAYILSALEKEV